MLGLLHTSPVHVAAFDRLRDQAAPGLVLHHVVAEELLARARRDGPESVTDDMEQAMRAAIADGVTAILCTCSTIGGTAEAAAGRLGVPVLRVDRPMAAAAVAAGPRIHVLVALASTLTPTIALLEEEAAGRDTAITWSVIDGAWAKFEAGDTEAYLHAVAAAISAVRDADVIVLAQASMAGAADRVATSVPVLSSPRLGMLAAAALT